MSIYWSDQRVLHFPKQVDNKSIEFKMTHQAKVSHYFLFCDGRTDIKCVNNDHLFGNGLVGQLLMKKVIGKWEKLYTGFFRFHYRSNGDLVNYFNWYNRYPHQTREGCVCFYSGVSKGQERKAHGKWHDLGCKIRTTYICQQVRDITLGSTLLSQLNKLIFLPYSMIRIQILLLGNWGMATITDNQPINVSEKFPVFAYLKIWTLYVHMITQINYLVLFLSLCTHYQTTTINS